MERTHIDIVIKAFKEIDDNKNRSTNIEYDRAKEQFILNDACDLLGTKKTFMKKFVCPHYNYCNQCIRDCDGSKRRECLKSYLAARWGVLHGGPKFRVGDVLYNKKHPDHELIKITDLCYFECGYPKSYEFQYLSDGKIDMYSINGLEDSYEKVWN